MARPVTARLHSGCLQLQCNGRALEIECETRILKGIGQADLPGLDTSRRHAAWNSEEVTAHHAMIPTGKPLADANLGDQKADAFKVYGLIVQAYGRKRFCPLPIERNRSHARK